MNTTIAQKKHVVIDVNLTDSILRQEWQSDSSQMKDHEYQDILNEVVNTVANKSIKTF